MHYISGWQALNVQSEQGHIADWHPNAYFKDFKPIKMYELSEHSPLKMLGIKKRFVSFCQDTYYVANYARAIADLLWYDETTQLQDCVREFLLDNEKQELFNYLKIMSEVKNVDDFIKQELPVLYLREKKNA